MAEVDDIRWHEQGYDVIITLTNGLSIYAKNDTIYTQRNGECVRKVDNATLNDLIHEIEFAKL